MKSTSARVKASSWASNALSAGRDAPSIEWNERTFDVKLKIVGNAHFEKVGEFGLGIAVVLNRSG